MQLGRFATFMSDKKRIYGESEMSNCIRNLFITHGMTDTALIA